MLPAAGLGHVLPKATPGYFDLLVLQCYFVTLIYWCTLCYSSNKMQSGLILALRLNKLEGHIKATR